MSAHQVPPHARADLDQRAANWANDMRCAHGVDVNDPETRRIVTALVVDLVQCLNVLGPRDPMGTAGAALIWTMYVVTATGGTVDSVEVHQLPPRETS